MSGKLEDDALKLKFACSSAECLLVALRGTSGFPVLVLNHSIANSPIGKSTPDNSEDLFPDAQGLTNRLLALISLGQTHSRLPIEEDALQKLVSNSFATLVEASLRDAHIWDALKQNTQIQDLIFNLLLAEPRQGIRKEVAEIVFGLCGSSPKQKQDPNGDRVSNRLSTPLVINIVATFWASLTALFPRTLNYAQSSQEFFQVALVVFEAVAVLSPGGVFYGEYLREWGKILLGHRTREVSLYILWQCFQHYTSDKLTCLFSSLLEESRWTILFLDSFICSRNVWSLRAQRTFPMIHGKKIILFSTHLLQYVVGLGWQLTWCLFSNLMEDIFTSFLFPNLSAENEDGVINPTSPLMHSVTRQELYNVLMLLCEDSTNFRHMLDLLDETIPYGSYLHTPPHTRFHHVSIS